MDNASKVERFRNHQTYRGFSERTVIRRSYTIEALLAHADNKSLADITSDDIEGFLSRYTCAQTRQSFRSDINQLFRYMQQRGEIQDNPCERVPVPKIPLRAPTPLTTEEIHLVLRVARPVAKLLVMLACFAGLRCTEIANLRGEDIDLEHRILVVRGGKGGRDGTVPIADVLAAELRKWPRTGPLTSAVTRDAVYGRIKTAFHRAGVEHRPHDLRHSYATSAARQANGNLRAVQLLMRHASVTATERYVKYNPSGLDIVNGLYGGDAA